MFLIIRMTKNDILHPEWNVQFKAGVHSAWGKDT